MADEEHKPRDEGAEKPERAEKAAKRDYAQRAHDVVREVEKRHAERHAEDGED